MSKVSLHVRINPQGVQLATLHKNLVGNRQALSVCGPRYSQSSSSPTFHYRDGKLVEPANVRFKKNEGMNLFENTHILGKFTRRNITEEGRST